MVQVNLLAVLACGVAAMVLGSLWYSPLLFGNIWMKELGIKKEAMTDSMKKKMIVSYIFGFIGSLVTAYVLGQMIAYNSLDTFAKAVWLGLFIWLGFIAPVSLGGVLWEGKSVKLYFINNFYNIVQLAIYTAIFVNWPATTAISS